MIVIMMNDSIEEGNELRVALRRQATLKHGQLQPLTETFHQAKDTAPALRVRYIVRHEIEVLARHRYRVVKFGYSASSPSK